MGEGLGYLVSGSGYLVGGPFDYSVTPSRPSHDSIRIKKESNRMFLYFFCCLFFVLFVLFIFVYFVFVYFLFIFSLDGRLDADGTFA